MAIADSLRLPLPYNHIIFDLQKLAGFSVSASQNGHVTDLNIFCTDTSNSNASYWLPEQHKMLSFYSTASAVVALAANSQPMMNNAHCSLLNETLSLSCHMNAQLTNFQKTNFPLPHRMNIATGVCHNIFTHRIYLFALQKLNKAHISLGAWCVCLPFLMWQLHFVARCTLHTHNVRTEWQQHIILTRRWISCEYTFNAIWYAQQVARPHKSFRKDFFAVGVAAAAVAVVNGVITI